MLSSPYKMISIIGGLEIILLIISLYAVNYTILIEQSNGDYGDYDGRKYYSSFSLLHIQSLILNTVMVAYYEQA